MEEKNENKAQVPKKLGGLKAQSAKLKQAEEAKVKIVEVNEKIAHQEIILKTLEQDCILILGGCPT